MRKLLLSITLCSLLLLFGFSYGSPAWTLSDSATASFTEENPPLPTKVFLPIISGNPITDVTNSTATDVLDTTWPRYEATYYSFTYPDDREVKEANGGQYIRLSPGSAQKAENKIEFAYLGYEISGEEDLLTWYNEYAKAATGEIPTRRIVERSSREAVDGSVIRKLHEEHASGEGSLQTVLLAHGNLVLSINAYTDSESITAVLKTIADSVEFYPNAPKTLRDLTPESPPTVTTLEQLHALKQPPEGIDIAPESISTKEEVPPGMPIPPPVPHSDEFLEWEERYQKLLDDGVIPEPTNNSADIVKAAGVVVPERQALLPEFRSPVYVNVDVGCSSPFHSGRSAYAIDIEVGSGTQVLAVNDATINFAGWYVDWGYLIRAYSDVVGGGGLRRYWHNYAHLSVMHVAAGNTVNISGLIADSGNTGGTSTGPHLHLHMTRDVNFNDVTQHPVDLSRSLDFNPT